MTKKIKVILLDADNCIFNQRAMEYKKNQRPKHPFTQSKPEATDWDETDIYQGSQQMMDFIWEDLNKNGYYQSFVMCGSNRLSFNIDTENSYMGKTGSFFPVLQTITDFLQSHFKNVDFIPLLLSDIFCNLTPGSAYQKAMVDKEAKVHPNCPLEDTKGLWIYTVMHYLAIRFPSPEFELEIDLYDDKRSLLDGLASWLQHNPTLMPPASLSLYQYDGNATPDPIATITGTGPVDTAYPITAKAMASTMGFEPSYSWFDPTNRQCRLDLHSLTPAKIAGLSQAWTEQPAEDLCAFYPCMEEGEEEDDEASMKRFQQKIPRIVPRRSTAFEASTNSVVSIEGGNSPAMPTNIQNLTQALFSRDRNTVFSPPPSLLLERTKSDESVAEEIASSQPDRSSSQL